MKRIKISMLAVMAALAGFASCEKPVTTPPEPEKAMEIDAEASYEVISTTPKDVTFNINSNTPWQITSDAEWCTVSPMSSDESSLVEEITVSFADNEDLTDRTAKVTITGEGIKAPTIITFNQAKKSNLEVQQMEGNFMPAGGEKTFTIVSNVAWTVESNQTWLTFDKTSGEGTSEAETVTATCAVNDSAERTAVITVNAGSVQKTFEVIQEGLFIRFKEVLDKDKLFNIDGTMKAYEFETNAEEVEVTTDDENAKAVINGKTVELTLGINSIFSTRNVKVTIVPKGKDASDFEGNVLEVSQAIYWSKNLSTNDQINNKEHPRGPGEVILDAETGKATLVTENCGRSRVYTGSWNTLVRYEFDFESVSVGEDFLIDLIGDNRAPLVSWELILGTNNELHLTNTLVLNAGGECKKTDDKKGLVKGEKYPTIPNWSGVKKSFDFTAAEANAMKKLIVEFKPNEGDASQIDILVQADEKVLVNATVANPYLHKGKIKNKNYHYNYGQKMYMGFPGSNWNGDIGLNNTPGTIVLKSAKVTTLD